MVFNRHGRRESARMRHYRASLLCIARAVCGRQPPRVAHLVSPMYSLQRVRFVRLLRHPLPHAFATRHAPTPHLPDVQPAPLALCRGCFNNPGPPHAFAERTSARRVCASVCFDWSSRAGRFDRLIYVGLPNESARLEILVLHTARMPLANDVSLHQLAADTAGYSGAELAAICREAAQTALYERLDSVQVCQLLAHASEAGRALNLPAPCYSMATHARRSQPGEGCPSMPISLLTGPPRFNPCRVPARLRAHISRQLSRSSGHAHRPRR